MAPTIDKLTIEIINLARSPEDLFGFAFDEARIDTKYRQLVRLVHPDVVSVLDRPAATEVFQKLVQLKRQADYKHRVGTYGDLSAPNDPPAAPPPTVIETKKRKYAITTQVCQGEVADLYRATYEEDDKVVPVVLKVVSHPGDSDLLENEATVLAKLNGLDLVAPFESFMRFVPKLHDSFVMADKGKRRVNVLPDFDEFFSLLEVYKAKDAIDFRDMVWMFKRTLEALGFIHRQGFVHGAITPPHVLVHPISHGAKLVGWSAATAPGQKLKIASKAWRAFYAPEVLAEKPVSAATDIYMATKAAVFLVGGTMDGKMPPKVPAEIQRFLKGCLAPAPTKRPDDAWAVRDEFAELLQKLVGKPTYRKLDMPARA